MEGVVIFFKGSKSNGDEDLRTALVSRGRWEKIVGQKKRGSNSEVLIIGDSVSKALEGEQRRYQFGAVSGVE